MRTRRIGQTVGPFEIDGELPAGGMGDVYHARHVRLRNKEVAIKFLREDWAADRYYRALFFKEAQRLAKLSNNNIIELIDYDELNGVPYMIFPYMSSTLRDYLRRKTSVEPLTVVSYIKQIGTALEYMHDQRPMILHRDIKPENILLRGRHSEQALVIDFSFAVETLQTPYTFSIDQDSLPPGEYTYFPPEYLDGKVYRTSDEYSLAVVTYELLCGRPPFLANTIGGIEVLTQHLQATPPLLRPRINIPRAMEAAVMKALAKDPTRRYPTVREFTQAFEAASVNTPFKRYWAIPRVFPKQPTPNLQVVSQERRRVLRDLAVLVGGGAAAFDLARAIVPNLFAPAPITIYEGHTGPVTAVAWLPGSTFLASLDLYGELHIWNALTKEKIGIYRHSGVSITLPRSVAWGSKGRAAFISADQKMSVIDAFAGTPIGSFTPPSKEEPLTCLAWSANQEHLLLGYGGKVLVFDALEAFDASGFYKQDSSYVTGGIVRTLASSPSSQQVVTTVDDQVYIWTAENAQRITQFKTGQGIVLSVDWSPDGKSIVTAGIDHTIKAWQILPGAFAFDEVVFSSAYEHADKVLAVAWSPDGQYIASAGADKMAKIWTPDRHSTVYTLEHQDMVMDVAWSRFISQDGFLLLATSCLDSKVRVWGIPQKPLSDL